MLLSASAFTQVTPAVSIAACGPANVSFKVKLDQSHRPLAQPEPGKALVYFLHDAGTNQVAAYPTVKFAIDGTWAGADHGNSYFSASVNPGEHHVCVTLQSSVVAPRLELAHFTAEPEKIYYYRTRLVVSRSVELLELEPIDSDQAAYLISSFPLSTAIPKK